MTRIAVALSLVVACLLFADANALAQRRFPSQARPGPSQPIQVPVGVQVDRNVAYGSDASERFDVYHSATAKDAPVIFMVHGGGWRRGDKGNSNVVQNKLDRWVPKGFVFISVNYPLSQPTTPLQQAKDVAKALAVAQRDAQKWGGNPNQFILMGHSAGAHLVALITSEPSLALSQGAKPWLGTIALDSGAYNVPADMQLLDSRPRIAKGPMGRMYHDAFGNDPSAWAAESPMDQLQARTAPFLAVCSTQRAISCREAQAYVARAKSFGTDAEVLPEDLTHREINVNVGQPNAYTGSVEAFMRRLGPAVAARLGTPER